jgi:hypothetical protein
MSGAEHTFDVIPMIFAAFSSTIAPTIEWFWWRRMPSPALNKMPARFSGLPAGMTASDIWVAARQSA